MDLCEIQVEEIKIDPLTYPPRSYNGGDPYFLARAKFIICQKERVYYSKILSLLTISSYST